MRQSPDEIGRLDERWQLRLLRLWSSPAFDDLLTRTGYGEQAQAMLQRPFHGALDGLTDSETPENLYFLAVPAAPTLNAFTTRSRTTGVHAVVASLDMLTYVGMSVHLVIGLVANRSEENPNEYCTHVTDEQRFDALDQLARTALQKLPAAAADNPALWCISEPDHPFLDFHDAFSVTAEMCVFMHELGHMALGHLQDPDAASPIGTTQADLIGFEQQRELDADWFAIERVTARSAGTLLPDDVLFAFGCFLVLLYVKERHSSDPPPTTHPPAMVRWRALYDRLDGVRRESMAFRLDHLMRYLEATLNRAGTAMP